MLLLAPGGCETMLVYYPTCRFNLLATDGTTSQVQMCFCNSEMCTALVLQPTR